MKPTRWQLLTLAPGQEIYFEGMRVWRPHVDPRCPDAKDLHFSKHYLEGKFSYVADQDLMFELPGNPWGFISSQLDQLAAEKGARHRDGTPVRKL